MMMLKIGLQLEMSWASMNKASFSEEASTCVMSTALRSIASILLARRSEDLDDVKYPNTLFLISFAFPIYKSAPSADLKK